jgi:hypothetical protein
MVPTETISKHLERTRRRIERWRDTRPSRHAAMPAALWRAAVVAARRHGLYQTARALRVDYGALKKRVDAFAWPPAADTDGPVFVELPSPRPSSPTPCVIELETPRGTLRISRPDLTLPDLVVLLQRTWTAHR